MGKNLLLTLILACYSLGLLHAQLLTADPAFPTVNDAVTITFDATQGTGGLANCGCDVYLHTGVITSESTGPSDWKNVQTEWGEANADWKMTPVPGEANKYTYTIGPSIADYYGVTEGIEILQMAFVFRNGDGSLEGKGPGNTDIYYDVYSDNIPLSLNLTSPQEDDFTIALGQYITISAVASVDASLTINLDGNLLAEASNSSELTHEHRVVETGTHVVEFIASDGVNTVSSSFTYTAEYRVDVLQPENSVVVTNNGAVIPVLADAYIESDITIFVNDVEVASTTNDTDISTTINISGGGAREVVVAAAYNGEVDTADFLIIVPDQIVEEDPPGDYPHGPTYLGDGSYLFQLYAPNKDIVFLLGDFNDYQASLDNQMKRSLDGNIWWMELDGFTEGESYTFQYLVDGDILVADPYSTLVLDPWNDPFIPEETYPNLPAYPSGKTVGIVTLLQPGATEYQWQVDDFTPVAKEKLVVYELLLRDFIDRHDYTTLIDTLDYLSNLGITAIELMPVNEFEGNISWGYNPSFHMALDKYYGPINELKRFVDECHSRGIAVILDVVYNHAFSLCPLARLYWDPVAFKPTPDNPWLNPDARHPFNVGYDFNHESEATRYYVDQVMRYWIEEFRVDGFRYDLSKGFTQTFNSDVGAWGNYDASRIEIIKHYADVVWDANPNFYVILEHFAANNEEIELTTYGNGMLSWSGGGLHNQYLEAALGFPSNLSGAFYSDRGWTEPNLVTYMESHDEERMMYKNEQFGNSSGDYDVRNTVTGLLRAELASTFFYTVPGPKMLWQFGEVGYNYSINHCPDGSIAEGCRVDPKPIRWDFYESANRKRLYDVTRALIELHTDYEVFSTTDYSYDLNTYAKKIHLNHEEMDAAVLGNFNVEAMDIQQPFQHEGWWYEYFSGDSILVEDLNQALNFNPGEYRLYTTVRLNEPPGGFVSATRELVSAEFQLALSPNPATDYLTLEYQLPEVSEVEIQVLNLLGQPISTLQQERQPAGRHQLGAGLNLAAGVYLVQLRAGGKIQVKRLVVQ